MRPKLIQCDKCTTFFDPSQHSRCPYCPVPGLNVSGAVGATIGVTPPPVQWVPPVSPEPPTVGGAGAAPGRAPGPGSEGVTVGVYPSDLRIDPVVGWLVCIAGNDRGRDYRIYSDRNFIGRLETMKICIKGDETISRERHTEINFDSRHNEFYIAPGDGRGNTYLNDRPVLDARPLKAWDIIEIGKTKLLFLPLCGQRFNWIDSLIPPPAGATGVTA
jgi:hypothetical protein